jgi:hypothetical protein
VRLSAQDAPAGELAVRSYFTPTDWEWMLSMDKDFGSSAVVLIDGTNLAMTGSKKGHMLLMDMNKLGGVAARGAKNRVVQEVAVSKEHIHGTPLVWKDPKSGDRFVYVWAEADSLKQFRMTVDPSGSKGHINAKPVSVGNVRLNSGDMPGGFISLSFSDQDPDNSSIVWVAYPRKGYTANGAIAPGVLAAYDARNVSRELWSSETNLDRDYPGPHAKFAPPTIADGKVFIGTFNVDRSPGMVCKIVAYGLLNEGSGSGGIAASGAPRGAGSIAALAALVVLMVTAAIW